MKVEPIETLLKEYKDKDLIHYVRITIERIMERPDCEGLSAEANLAMQYEALNEPLEILRAVDKRMNGSSDDPRVVL